METVLPPFRHNPSVIGPTPDGYYLLFFIGAGNASGEIDCTSGIPPVPLHPNPPSNGYITMAATRDVVAGPWQQRVILRDNKPGDNQSSWHCTENNPSATVLPNGTVVLVFRANSCTAHGEHLGVATAPHWSAEFVRDEAPIVDTASSVNNEGAYPATRARAARPDVLRLFLPQIPSCGSCATLQPARSRGTSSTTSRARATFAARRRPATRAARTGLRAALTGRGACPPSPRTRRKSR